MKIDNRTMLMQVPGYPHYWCDTNGGIYYTKPDKDAQGFNLNLIHAKPSQNGYRMYCLTGPDGKKLVATGAKIVLMTF